MTNYLTSTLYMDDPYVETKKNALFIVTNAVPGVASIILKFIL